MIEKSKIEYGVKMEKIIEIFSEIQKEEISSNILNNLPEWFGLPESTKTYIEESKEMPFLAYYVDEKPVGFVVLKKTSDDTGEIYVMGILKEYHRRKVGTKLYYEFEKMAKEMNFSFLQVKTVQMGKYLEYDITNNFYISVGFKELECFPDMWDSWNPCQIYIKYIGQ